jgi:transketolase N-terminal domain/subunit
MSNKLDYHELETLAQRGRWLAISTVAGSGAGHVGGPFSAMDMLIALYFRVMNIRPEEPRWAERDRFILSKGHSSIGQYAAMALRGFLPIEELKTFDKGGSRLQGHPDVTRLPGLDTSTGSLGRAIGRLGLRFGWPDARSEVSYLCHAWGWRIAGGDGLGGFAHRAEIQARKSDRYSGLEWAAAVRLGAGNQ